MKYSFRGLFASLCGFLLFAGQVSAGSLSFDQKGDLAAFAESPGIPAPVPGAAAAAAELPGFCVFNGTGGSALDSGAAFAAIRGSDVVYVGESHDQANDHLAQLEALKALSEARGGSVVVGFEMLNMTLQPVLDEYASGKITEAEFLRKADWQKEWGFDFNLYKPIFDFIREKELSALALNLPKKIVSRIAMAGLAGLTPAEQKYLPANLHVTTDEKYIAYIKESFDGHMSDMFKFENYLAAMSAWNETMGARLADFINSNPGFAGLAVAGSGHIIYNAGIPASLKARAPGARGLSFIMQGADACPSAFPEDDKGLADYVWYVRHTGQPGRTRTAPLLLP
ncbi:MAG: ChaN family lipoprotein [Elusimicrobiota bacterium]|nr:ChaN family lipoprotein [Elusimicrobiota bacterium]